MRGPPPLPAKGAIAIAGRRGRCRCWKKGAAVAARIRGPPSMPPYSRCRCRKKGLLPLQGEGGRRRCLLVATAAARRRGHRRFKEKGTAFVGEGAASAGEGAAATPAASALLLGEGGGERGREGRGVQMDGVRSVRSEWMR
ncbi:hypothetical protein OsI_19833 [Oryza sativa Indica Group]|uniref:Uncharacterized protein n=1 Tax=Oryza sativa subsp. indica TaxID=39946 RepID=B8AXZ2_ORYSI|nr:hypothetical protein OsI_19833 [Oryza sativa Indica Group]